VFVCLSVCPLIYLKNHTCKFHQIFCYLWLGPLPTAMQYVTYFRFCRWRRFHIIDWRARIKDVSSNSPGGTPAAKSTVFKCILLIVNRILRKSGKSDYELSTASDWSEKYPHITLWNAELIHLIEVTSFPCYMFPSEADIMHQQGINCTTG